MFKMDGSYHFGIKILARRTNRGRRYPTLRPTHEASYLRMDVSRFATDGEGKNEEPDTIRQSNRTSVRRLCCRDALCLLFQPGGCQMKGSPRLNFTAVLVVISFLVLAGLLVYGVATQLTHEVEKRHGALS